MILGFLCRHKRFYIGHRRIHHGRVGVLMVVAGVACMIDDLFDFPWGTDR